MNARRKRLQRLIDLRRHAETHRREELGRAVRAEAEAATAVSAGECALRRQQDALRDALLRGGVTAGAWKRLGEDAASGEADLARLREAMRGASARRAVADRAFGDARRALRSLEKLDERWREIEAIEARRAEGKAADEVALRRFLAAGARRPEREIERESKLENEEDR